MIYLQAVPKKFLLSRNLFKKRLEERCTDRDFLKYPVLDGRTDIETALKNAGLMNTGNNSVKVGDPCWSIFLKIHNRCSFLYSRRMYESDDLLKKYVEEGKMVVLSLETLSKIHKENETNKWHSNSPTKRKRKEEENNETICPTKNRKPWFSSCVGLGHALAESIQILPLQEGSKSVNLDVPSSQDFRKTFRKLLKVILPLNINF